MLGNVTSFSNKLFIGFQSDSMKTDTGFSCVAFSIPKVNVIEDISQTETEDLVNTTIDKYSQNNSRLDKKIGIPLEDVKSVSIISPSIPMTRMKNQWSPLLSQTFKSQTADTTSTQYTFDNMKQSLDISRTYSYVSTSTMYVTSTIKQYLQTTVTHSFTVEPSRFTVTHTLWYSSPISTSSTTSYNRYPYMNKSLISSMRFSTTTPGFLSTKAFTVSTIAKRIDKSYTLTPWFSNSPYANVGYPSKFLTYTVIDGVTSFYHVGQTAH